MQGTEHSQSHPVCRLCKQGTEEAGRLLKSHVIPRFILLKSKDRGRALEFDRSAKRFSIGQTDWKEELMCESCEARLKYFDDIINDVFFLRRRSKLIFERRHHIAVAAVSDDVALALVSVFWRAVISDHEAFSWAVLPSYMEEAMRSWILDKRLDPRWGNLIEIRSQFLLLPGSDSESADVLIRPFVRTKPKSFEFVFICGGYCWTFVIPPEQTVQSPGRGDGRMRPGSRTLRIGKLPMLEVPELREAVKDMLSTPMPSHIRTALEEMNARAVRRKRTNASSKALVSRRNFAGY